jgi:hypothetical protein
MRLVYLAIPGPRRGRRWGLKQIVKAAARKLKGAAHIDSPLHRERLRQWILRSRSRRSPMTPSRSSGAGAVVECPRKTRTVPA